MNYAHICSKKPIGFRPQATMYYLHKPIAYGTKATVFQTGKWVPVPAQANYIVISPGEDPVTFEKETSVYPVSKAGYCLSWQGIGQKFRGHPTVESILKQLGYSLN